MRKLTERLVIMVPDKTIHAKNIQLPLYQEAEEKISESFLMTDSYKEAKNRFEKAFIAKKLREFNGNISQTAEAIGVERSNLHKKIKAYGLDDFRSQ